MESSAVSYQGNLDVFFIKSRVYGEFEKKLGYLMNKKIC